MVKGEWRGLKDDVHHRHIHDCNLEQHRKQYRADKKQVREQGKSVLGTDHGDPHHLEHHDGGEGNRKEGHPIFPLSREKMNKLYLL